MYFCLNILFKYLHNVIDLDNLALSVQLLVPYKSIQEFIVFVLKMFVLLYNCVISIIMCGITIWIF